MLLGVLGSCWFATRGRAAEQRHLRVGTLQFGTVSWELDVIKANGLDRANGFTLDVQGYGGNEATNVALLGGAVDAIVDDWLMVARDRGQGGNLTFTLPYSSALGVLMVKEDAPIRTLADLKGRTIGVAGGPLDKNWLLCRAYAAKTLEIDLAREVRPVFAAPPLLNAKLLSGELDAVLSYWNWCAILEAQHCRRLLPMTDALTELGIGHHLPQLGFVMQDRFVAANAGLVDAFGRAALAARTRLANDDAEWERLRPLTHIDDDATFAVIKQRYREGIVTHWDDGDHVAATQLYALLAAQGGEALVGRASSLPAGTFATSVKL